MSAFGDLGLGFGLFLGEVSQRQWLRNQGIGFRISGSFLLLHCLDEQGFRGRLDTVGRGETSKLPGFGSLGQ